MKKALGIVAVIVVAMVVFLFGLCSGNRKGESGFTGTVLEVHDGYIIVAPDEEQADEIAPILKKSSKIKVGRHTISGNNLPKICIGARIKVVYQGIIKGSDPPDLDNVVGLYEMMP